MTKPALEPFGLSMDSGEPRATRLQGGSGQLQGYPEAGARPANLVSAFTSGAIGAGDVLHCQNTTLFGRLIRRAIGSWGCHDALIAWHAGKPVVCDAAPIRARLTPLSEYDARIAAGKTQVLILRPMNRLSFGSGYIATEWWKQNVNGKFYDWAAFPRLLAKAIVGDRCSWPAGWEWAWYCTESCRGAWLAAGFDPWGKTNPTPRTTEKRTLSGQFRLVWHSTPANPLAIPPAEPAAIAAEGKEGTK